MKRAFGEELNAKEKRVLASMSVGVSMPIEDIARKAWGKRVGTKSRTRGNSWVRNCMRKLRKIGKVKKVGRGLYRRK